MAIISTLTHQNIQVHTQYTGTYTIYRYIHNTQVNIHNIHVHTQYTGTYTIHKYIHNTQEHTQYTTGTYIIIHHNTRILHMYALPYIYKVLSYLSFFRSDTF